MATAQHSPTTTAARPGRSAAQGFALAGGLTLLLVGVLGFLADSRFNTGSGVDGSSLLGFEVNGWHNVVHIVTGLLLLAGARDARRAIVVCLLFAAGYGIVTVWGLIDGDDVLGLVPINAADNALHVVLTLTALGAALVSRGAARDHAR